MRVAAGIFGFWQGVGEAPMPGGPWPSAATQPKAKKDAALEGFRPEEPGAALSAWGIAMPWIPTHAHAFQQAPLGENDTYSDLLDTLLELDIGYISEDTQRQLNDDLKELAAQIAGFINYLRSDR